MSLDLEDHLRQVLKVRLSAGARACLGYSGGLDSSVLLHALVRLRAELGFSLSAVHVHHGLSVHADAWAEHCRRTCAGLAVPLSVRRVALSAGREGIEAAARGARYRVYAEQDADCIVLAHHRDDQAETLLFRLLRGAGVHGLAAMAETRSHAGITLLRPLLAVGRDALAAYAGRHGIGYVEDESNGDLALTRNWLRHEVLPGLKARFPASPTVLARTAEQLGESAGLLDDLARVDLADVAAADGLDLAALAGLRSPRARNLLRYWLHRETGVVPSRAWLAEACTQLLDADPDRHPRLAVGACWLVRRAGRAVLASPAPPATSRTWPWRGEPELDLGDLGRVSFSLVDGMGVAAARLPPEGVRIGVRRGGEHLRPDCRRPTRTLKNLLREASVPAEARNRLPMLCVGERLVWVAGLGVDCAFQAGPDEPGWVISWSPPGR